MSTQSSNLFHTTGIRLPSDACVVLVKTHWNAETIDKLEKGCIEILDENKINYKIITVPGAFEITFAIKKYWESHKHKEDKPHAFIALGCILRGGTPHFEYVCQAVTNGITQLNLTLPIPVIFGILTVDNQQQIDERTGGIHGHKGKEAALSALQMISVMKDFI